VYATILAGAMLACSHPDGPAAAHHDVTLVGERLAIDTTFSHAPHPEARLVLAVPLPEHASIVGATPEHGPAGITALRFDPADERTLHLELDASDVESSGRLPLPVVCGTQVQRVRMDDAVAFLPDARLGLVVHMGRTQPATMSSPEREGFDRILPRQRTELGATYIATEAIVEHGGVLGALERRADSKQRVALGTGLVFVVLCGAGGLVYLRSRRDAEVEHAEAVLAAEIDGLDEELR
jgi:hypothetical protein